MGVLTSDPYLAEMRKSKQNQLTGGKETPGENVPQRALLLCCWGPHVAAAGGTTGIGVEWDEDGAGPVMGAGAGVAVGLEVAHDGPRVGA